MPQRSGNHWVTLRELANGREVGRALSSAILARWRPTLHGLVLDLGCGRRPGGAAYLNAKPNRARVVGIDRTLSYKPDVVADLIGTFPFRDGVADAVLCSNFLYIPLEPLAFLRRVRRVLKEGGTLILAVNVVAPNVRHPTDYWRFTGDSLRYLVELSGFEVEDLVGFGERFSVAAYALGPFLRPRRLVWAFVSACALSGDAAIRRLLYRRGWHPFPIGYCLRARAV